MRKEHPSCKHCGVPLPFIEQDEYEEEICDDCAALEKER